MGSVFLLVGWMAVTQAAGGLESLFETTTRDFGNVPHGSVNVHRFVLKNTTDRLVRAQSVRSSCKCATPSLIVSEAKPGEEIIVEVAFDASTFIGSRSMTIYVTFDEPRFETVSLRVSGYSRQDVVFNPGKLDFGIVSPGTAAKQKVRIEYGGSADWKIDEVLTPDHLEANVHPLFRQPGKIGYELEVGLKPETPPGTIQNDIQLKTNDPNTPVVTVHVSASIEAPLVASPDVLDLGDLYVGDKVAKRVLVRGSGPFNIKSVGGDTVGVQVKSTEGERKLHVLSIEFEATQPGKVEQQLRLRTDLGNLEPIPIRILANVAPR